MAPLRGNKRVAGPQCGALERWAGARARGRGARDGGAEGQEQPEREAEKRNNSSLSITPRLCCLIFPESLGGSWAFHR